MKRNNWKTVCASGLLICLMATGYLAVAAEYGSKDDPLITMSYINGVLTPGTNTKIEQAFSGTKTQIDSEIAKKLAELSGQVDGKIKDFESNYKGVAADSALIDAIATEVVKKLNGAGVAAEASWKVVSLEAGKTVAADVGCEILLRSGTAKCVAYGSPGLINLSSGTDLSNGAPLSANNLYIVTAEGRGIKTVSNTTVLILGKYSIV